MARLRVQCRRDLRRLGLPPTRCRTSGNTTALLRQRQRAEDEREDQQNDGHEAEYLPETPRPLTRHLPGTTIDEDVEEFLLIAVVRDPHW